MEEVSSPTSANARREGGALRFGPFAFDVESATLTREGVLVPLPPRATQVLEHLVTHAGELIRKETLLDSAWNGVAVSEQSLSEAIKVLRRALDDDAREPRYIQTVHRRGFRFVADVGREGPIPAAEKVPGRIHWVAPLAAAGLLAAWVLGGMARSPSALPPAELVARGAQPDSASLSPDGSKIGYTSWSGEIVVRDLSSSDDVLLDEHGALPGCPPVWSPDGSRVAYGFREEDQWQVRVTELIDRSPQSVFASRRDVAVTDWSRDGRRLLLTFFPGNGEARASLAELSVETGAVRELRKFDWTWPPRAFYSPDGGRIAYGSNEGDRGTIHLYDRHTGDDAPLTDAQSDESFPLWSPDGRFLVIRSRSDEDWDLWALALRGVERDGGPYLLEERAGDTYPWSWAPDGSLLSIQQSRRGEIWRFPVGGPPLEIAAEPSRFSEQLEESVQHGVPSPSGDRVAVLVAEESSSHRVHLLSRSEARLLPLPVDFHAFIVIGWAPDESWFLLWGRNPQGEDLFLRFHPDEGVVREIDIEPGPRLMGHFASLSPDGRFLALEEESFACDRNLLLLNLETGARSGLGVVGCRLMPAWSPDGREIVVARNLPDQKSELLVISNVGERRRTLGSWANEEFGKLGPLTWSPDGKSIVFLVHPPGLNELYVLPAEGGEPRLLYRPERVDVWKPYWPRGRAEIFFTAMRIESRLWKRRDVLARLQSN